MHYSSLGADANGETAEIAIDAFNMDNECLTSEVLERTFNNEFQKNFYQLCHIDIDLTATGFVKSAAVLNASKILDMSENHADTNEDVTNKSCRLNTQPIETTNKIAFNAETSKLRDVFKNSFANTSTNCTLYDDPNEQTAMNDLTTTVCEDDSSSNDTTTHITGATTQMTSTNLNETIVQAIRNPFCFEIKNRLLKRGHLEYLKSKSTYTSLMENVPVIDNKATVFLKGNFSPKILKELGKGSYAVIYLIESKDDKYALKVEWIKI